MTRDELGRALDGALEVWSDRATRQPGNERANEASLRHIEVFALAVCARELTEISRTLQARHEEAIGRGDAS